MKVKKLIDALKDLDPEAAVYVWDAGERIGLVNVDVSFLGEAHPFVDINTDTDADTQDKGKVWDSGYQEGRRHALYEVRNTINAKFGL